MKVLNTNQELTCWRGVGHIVTCSDSLPAGCAPSIVKFYPIANAVYSKYCDRFLDSEYAVRERRDASGRRLSTGRRQEELRCSSGRQSKLQEITNDKPQISIKLRIPSPENRGLRIDDWSFGPGFCT